MKINKKGVKLHYDTVYYYIIYLIKSQELYTRHISDFTFCTKTAEFDPQSSMMTELLIYRNFFVKPTCYASIPIILSSSL